jgi:hypothetical protein
VLQPLDVPTLDMVRGLSKIRCDEEEGDFLDAIIVGVQLIHARTQKKKYKKRIYLITDAANQVRDYEQCQQIVDRMKELEIELYVM